MKRAALCAWIVSGLVGCIRMSEEILVMPDGAGKILYTVAMNPAFASFGGGEAKDPLDEFMSGDPDEFEKKAPGIVAMARPERADVGGWKGIRLTLYFEDINKFQMMDDDGQRERSSFVFRKEGDGYAFEIVDKSFQGDEQPEEQDAEKNKKEQEKFREFMKGFEYKATVKLPGKVKSAEGYTTKDGRSASISVSDKDLQDQKDFKKFSTRKATCGASEVTDEEVAAFQKELAKAKAEWAGLKDEMRKNAAKKKKEENP